MWCCAVRSDREGNAGIWWQRADGSGLAERLTKPEQGVSHIPDSWSPDGRTFSFTAVKGEAEALWTFSTRDKRAALFREDPAARLDITVAETLRCAITARVQRAERMLKVDAPPPHVAPLNAARTSQRDVPTKEA